MNRDHFKKAFLEKFPEGKIDVFLKNYCNFRIGGPAQFFYLCKKVSEIPDLIRMARESDVPFYLIGRGTNVLFADEGFSGLIIANYAKEILAEGSSVIADSGATLSDIIAFGLGKRLGGIEGVFCLPGTIGGAVFGNAGSFGLETQDFLEAVEYYDVDKDSVQWISRQNLFFSYRDSTFKKEKIGKWIILRVKIAMQPFSKMELPEVQKKLREIAALRSSKQPPGATCGSFFKNSYHEDGTLMHAGKMIEECGLKGLKVGGAQISEKHGNFLLNVNNASAADILAIAQRIKADVFRKFGVRLDEEVRIMNK